MRTQVAHQWYRRDEDDSVPVRHVKNVEGASYAATVNHHSVESVARLE